MAKIEINKEETLIVEEPIMEQPPVVEDEIPFTDAEVKAYSTPANWNIKVSEEELDQIEAVNYSTGETFKGTIEEFNTFLRG